MSCFTCLQLRPGCIIRAAAQVDDELSTLLSLDEDTVAQNMVATGGPKQRRRSHHGWSNREFGAMTIACRGIRLTQMKLEDWKQSLLRDHDQETVTWTYVYPLGSTTCLFHATLWFAGLSCPAFGKGCLNPGTILHSAVHRSRIRNDMVWFERWIAFRWLDGKLQQIVA